MKHYLSNIWHFWPCDERLWRKDAEAIAPTNKHHQVTLPISSLLPFPIVKMQYTDMMTVYFEQLLNLFGLTRRSPIIYQYPYAYYLNVMSTVLIARTFIMTAHEIAQEVWFSNSLKEVAEPSPIKYQYTRRPAGDTSKDGGDASTMLARAELCSHAYENNARWKQSVKVNADIPLIKILYNASGARRQPRDCYCCDRRLRRW